MGKMGTKDRPTKKDVGYRKTPIGPVLKLAKNASCARMNLKRYSPCIILKSIRGQGRTAETQSHIRYEGK